MQLQNKKILHITPHLGGGVGKVISGILEYEVINKSDFKHKIIILEAPENLQFVEICHKIGIKTVLTDNLNTIEDEIKNADVIVMHWWHHPLNAWLLANFPKTPTRIVLWTHINGCTYPMLPFNLVKNVNKALFTSKYTLENPYWSKKEQEIAKENANIVYGLGKLEKIKINKKEKQSNFVIGYVGTLNFSKLNPDFVEYCNEVIKLIPSSKFVMVGNPDGKERILSQAKIFGIDDKFEFVGYTNNVLEQLEKFDVFGYPLNPWHFGTTENSILEAISASVPVVVLNQCSEKYLIKNNETGFLANDKKHYALVMKDLFDNPQLGSKISQNAQKYLEQEFSMGKNVKNLKDALINVLEDETKIFDFRFIFGSEPYEWFLSCLGEDREIFEQSLKANSPDIEKQIENCRDILKENSKSSINHFLKYFEEDLTLKYWNDIINKKKDIL